MAKTEPLSQAKFEEMVDQLLAQREILLALIRPLSHTMRNWKPNESQRNIHELLLHIGLDECRLVSHLGKIVSTPSEVTLMRYLHQSRASVLERLHSLSEEERSQEFPDGWTAARVLNEMLLQEKEQISRIETIVSEWRLHLFARLAAERAELFTVLLGLSAEQLSTSEPLPGWTIKDLLAHVAFWDGFYTNRMQMVVDGRIQEITEIGNDADLDAFNAKLLAQNKEMPLEQAIAMLQKERSGFTHLLQRIGDVALQSQIRLPWGWRTHMRVWARWRYQHDAEHAQQIQTWRDEQPHHARRQIGPKALLRGLLRACRKEFTALLPLLPQAEWVSRPVCGVWTMKDLVGHLTAWAEVGGQAVAQALTGETVQLNSITDFEQWNQDEAAKRADLPWETIWEAYEASYQKLLSGLDALPDDALAIEFSAPWGPQITLYRWFTIWPLHEREHAVDVRHALNLTRWPKRLIEHPQNQK